MPTTSTPPTHHHPHGPANRGRRVLATAAPLFVQEPLGPARGGVIVLHDVFGLTEHIEHYCRSLAGQGWLAVAPYHYYDTGGRVYPELETARAALGHLTAHSLWTDVAGASHYLTERRGVPGGSVTVVGFSLGGYVAAWAAAERQLAGAVSVSPGAPDTAPLDGTRPLRTLIERRRTPWLAVVGEQDAQLPAAQLAALREAAATPAGQPASVEVIPAAEHGFYRDDTQLSAVACWRTVEHFLTSVSTP